LTKSKIAGFDREQVLAPLVIGITGHRDIREEDRQVLEHKVKEIFLQFRKDYSATPLILLSALAEGADRLAAKVAVSPEVGVRLVVLVPMPIDLYLLDFDSISVLGTPLGTAAANSSSREEFRALLDKAYTRFELGLVDGEEWETIAKPGPERDRQYELVGKYIAQQSQILIALWDGVDSNRVGGTASVIHFQTGGVPGPDPCALEAPEGFPVYHILTPRLTNPYPQGEVLSLRTIYPKVFQGNQAHAHEYYGKMFGRLNEFNRYITHADRGLDNKVIESKNYLLQNMREDELPAGMGSALNRYAVADALAIRFQKRLFWAQVLLHVGTFSAFLCFLLFVDLKDYQLYFLAASGILSIGVGVLRILSGKWALDTQHEDYRAMAEGLRVKFFWKLAGITESVADHYLGKQRSELDWIRNGFRGWNVGESPQNHEKLDSLDGEDQRNRLEFVRKYWIHHQQRYFHRAAKRNLKYHELIERLGNICVGAVVVLGLVLLFLCVRNIELHRGLAVIGLEALLAAAALLHHFNNRMAYAEYKKQYDRMDSLFARGSDLLGKFLKSQDYKNASRCVKKVGIEALTENGDWVFLRRERPVEVPHP